MNDFEASMRRFEWLGQIKVPSESFIVLRLDGKGFSKFTKGRFAKPFDTRMSELMVKSVSVLMKEFGAVYGFTESDEMSLLLPPGFDLYDREVEKIVSISSSIVASNFAMELYKAGLAGDAAFVGFDSRVWCSENPERVKDYFQWRAADAVRCGLNSWAYWTMLNNGINAAKATKTLEGQGTDFKNELLFQYGVNFNDVPNWQKRGVGIYWETYTKEARNKLTDEVVTAQRRRLKVDRDLPLKEEYSRFILDRIIAPLLAPKA